MMGAYLCWHGDNPLYVNYLSSVDDCFRISKGHAHGTSKPRLDRRIVCSRNAILSAFERLLMEKPLADITVSAARGQCRPQDLFAFTLARFDGPLGCHCRRVVEMIVDSVEKRFLPWTVTQRSALSWRGGDLFKTVNEALYNFLVLNRRLIGE